MGRHAVGGGKGGEERGSKAALTILHVRIDVLVEQRLGRIDERREKLAPVQQEHVFEAMQFARQIVLFDNDRPR
jgi:hypothetical protein